MFDMEEWKSRGNYSEIVDCVISRMQMEHLKKRIQEVFGNAEKELIFYDSRHRNDFSSLLLGRRKIRMNLPFTAKHRVLSPPVRAHR